MDKMVDYSKRNPSFSIKKWINSTEYKDPLIQKIDKHLETLAQDKTFGTLFLTREQTIESAEYHVFINNIKEVLGESLEEKFFGRSESKMSALTGSISTLASFEEDDLLYIQSELDAGKTIPALDRLGKIPIYLLNKQEIWKTVLDCVKVAFESCEHELQTLIQTKWYGHLPIDKLMQIIELMVVTDLNPLKMDILVFFMVQVAKESTIMQLDDLKLYCSTLFLPFKKDPISFLSHASKSDYECLKRWLIPQRCRQFAIEHLSLNFEIISSRELADYLLILLEILPKFVNEYCSPLLLLSLLEFCESETIRVLHLKRTRSAMEELLLKTAEIAPDTLRLLLCEVSIK